MRSVERALESLLFSSRFLVLVAVLASLVAAAAMMWLAAVDTVTLVIHAVHYAGPGATAESQQAVRLASITHVVEIVDGFLLAAFLVIFGLGLYELFVSKIEAAEGSVFADSILYVRSLDDLKGKLAKVVLIMLIVKFFEQAVAVRAGSTLELLWAASGVALVALAIYLAHLADRKGDGAGH